MLAAVAKGRAMAAKDEHAGMMAELAACEDRVWRALVAGDARADAAALADGFLGVYPDGFAGKTAHVAQLAAGPTVVSYDLSDRRMLRLGADHALLAYRAEYRRVGAGRPEVMYVTSIWQRGPGGWINVFSQDTPAGPGVV